MPRILALWEAKSIRPKFHLSEPRKGAVTPMVSFADSSNPSGLALIRVTAEQERRAHADRCQSLPTPLPDDIGARHIVLPFSPVSTQADTRKSDLMIEAKDKEQAVFHLYRIYNLAPTIHGR